MRLVINNIKTADLDFSNKENAIAAKKSIVETARLACIGTSIAECKNEDYIFQWATKESKFLRTAFDKAMQ